MTPSRLPGTLRRWPRFCGHSGIDMKQRTDLLADGVLIFFLWGVAVAQPLYDVLSRGAESFVARRSEPIDVLAMAAVVSLLLPGTLLAALALVGRWSRPARGLLHGIVVSALFAVIFLPVLKRIEILPDLAVLLAAGAAGATCGVTLSQWRPLRERYFLIPASAVAFGLPVWFLFATPVRKVLMPQQSASPADARTAPRLQTPVVLIVLDELPTTTLMNEKREIDGGFFPGFHALAAESTWYRNATTVAVFTEDAVPAILTGRYPEPNRLPTTGDYPDNLFTLLGGRNELIVTERTTELCPRELCDGKDRADSLTSRLRALFSDLRIVYGHAVMPEKLARETLPPVSSAWHGFAADAGGDEPRSTTQEPRGRIASVQDFIGSIRPTSRPALYYLHAGLPHHPWQFTATGKRYEFSRAKRLRRFSGSRWSTDGWHSIQGLQRHVMQTMFADRLIAKLIGRLKATDLYDPALIILTADHGLSFRPGDARRKLTATNARDLMPVPLLVKLPHQRAGRIDDGNVETIDILPAIAQVQGFTIPWALDGRPLGSAEADRDSKTIFNGAVERRSVSFKLEDDDVLTWKLKVMGAGDPMRLFAISPNSSYRGLIGQPADADRSAARSKCILDFPRIFGGVEPDSLVMPSLVTGRLQFDDTDADRHLAIAVNGIVRAVTRTYQEGAANLFSAMVPETSFRAGRNNVEVFIIRDGPDRTPRLSSVSMSDHPYALERTAEPPGEVIRSAGGEVFPVGSGEIDGRVNRGTVRKKVVVFRGWAADVEAKKPVDVVLIFENDEFRFSGRPGRARRGPGRGAAIRGSGFELIVPKSVFSDLDSAEIRCFAWSEEGSASELRYAPTFQWRREAAGG